MRYAQLHPRRLPIIEALSSEIEDMVETFRQMILDSTNREPSAEDIENLTNFAAMHSEYLDSAIN